MLGAVAPGPISTVSTGARVPLPPWGEGMHRTGHFHVLSHTKEELESRLREVQMH